MSTDAEAGLDTDNRPNGNPPRALGPAVSVVVLAELTEHTAS